MRFLSVLLFLLLLGCSAPKGLVGPESAVNPYRYTINKKAMVRNGAVASAHPLASKVGVEMMRLGGNAFDAAVATQLALAVVYPGAGNLGGGGFLVARRANGETVALDYRETAPQLARRDMYLDAAGKVMPGKSLNGHLAAGVPGTVAGLFESMTYAKLPLKTLIQPAIDLAEKGFAITGREAATLNDLQEEFAQYNTVRTAFQKATAWRPGDTLVQTDLANTLKRIRDNGAAGFYEGRTAQLVIEEMRRGNGIITLDDLRSYKAKWREPHQFAYKGFTVVGMPMPSSGGLLLHQMMKMVEERPLATYGFQNPLAVQLMIEAERRAYADRAEYMGDADFYDVPTAKLTDTAYLNRRMQDYKPGEAGSSTVTKPGTVARKTSEQTTHLSVIDAEGNAVSVTTTLNNNYGSKTVVGGAGFLLNDEMDDFSVKPGVPNLYGAVGGEANAIAPGKRMLSSMTPTIVLKDGKPFLVVGTPGGTTIPTSVYQTIINVIDFGLSTDDAVNKPKFHHQWLPDEVFVERSLPASLKDALQKMGYKLMERGGIGRVEAIKLLPDGTIEAIADGRGDDAAEGF